MHRALRVRPRTIALMAVFLVAGVAAAYALSTTHCEPKAPPPATAPIAAASHVDLVRPAVPGPSATLAEAAPASTRRASAARAASRAPYGAAGMIVGIDPATGQLRAPTPEQRAALTSPALASPALDRSMTGLTVVRKPDGSQMIDLQGRFQEYMVVHLTPDGHKVERCVQGPQVEAALGSAPAPAPATIQAPVPNDAAPPTSASADR